MSDAPHELDACVIGGGAAGLCTLDALHERGCGVWLIESVALGTGQTIASQGIIHGGLKYALGGTSTAAARTVSAMPGRWRACLDGTDGPDLGGTTLRARSCHVWSSGGTSIAGLLGAKLALRTTPTKVADADRPVAPQGVRSSVLEIGEPVIEPSSFLRCLSSRHSDRLLLDCVADIETTTDGVLLTLASGHRIHAGRLILAAGSGNAALLALAGLETPRMQTRPLRMVMARGDLPVLNGHCIKGVSPWLTITTTVDTRGTTLWQIGGAVAEDGVDLTPAQTITRARDDLTRALPGIDLSQIEFGTYTAVRAEHATGDGHRPDDPAIVRDDRIWTVWPTKLALAPAVADDIAATLDGDRGPRDAPESLPRPDIARPPWEEASAWTSASSAAQA